MDGRPPAGSSSAGFVWTVVLEATRTGLPATRRESCSYAPRTGSTKPLGLRQINRPPVPLTGLARLLPGCR
ncbi:hypothetical protein GCM10020229_00350 [Kitasatospora albolonga]